jgi:hypothetical protein
VLSLALLTVGACAHPESLAPPTRAELSAPAALGSGEAAARFEEVVGALPREPLRRIDAIESLGALASALDIPPRGLFSSAGRIREYANEVASSSEAALEEARPVKAALLEAVHGLQESMDEASPPMKRALLRARSWAVAIDPSAPLSEESDAVRQALVSLARVLVLAAGDTPRLPSVQEAADTEAPVAGAGDDVARLRRLVHELSLSHSSKSRATALETLRVFQRALVRKTGVDARDPGAVDALRFQIARFEISTALHHAEPARDALEAALEALTVAASDRGNDSEAWLSAARMAIESISDTTPYGLQRARIQDAFRSLVDAFAAVL